MSKLFDVAELVKVAVEDERTGVAFYSKLAEKTGLLKDFFADLAEQEKHHLRRFEEVLTHLGGVKSAEEYPGQYLAYLEVLTGSRAFPDEASAIRAADQCADDEEAVNLAHRYERDTLMLINEMRSLLPDKAAATANEVADEERSHLVALAEARKKLT